MLKFITGNKNKYYEVSRHLSPIKLKQVKINLDEIQEIDPFKIINHKLKQAFKHSRGPFLIEDDSLYLEFLGGKLPGPLIKWFNDTMGNPGLYELARKTGKNKAEMLTLIGLAENSHKIVYFTGRTKGQIVKAKGGGGFEFDLIFKPDGQTQTAAQLKAKGIYLTSARAKAVKKLKKYLLNNQNEKQ